jgi:hypothetical protein
MFGLIFLESPKMNLVQVERQFPGNVDEALC